MEAEPWKVREGTCSAIIERCCRADAGSKWWVGLRKQMRVVSIERSVLLLRAGKYQGYMNLTFTGQNEDQA